MKKEMLYRIFSRMPVMKTDRLTLRRLTVSDTADMFEYARREDVTRYLGLTTLSSVPLERNMAKS